MFPGFDGLLYGQVSLGLLSFGSLIRALVLRGTQANWELGTSNGSGGFVCGYHDVFIDGGGQLIASIISWMHGFIYYLQGL